MNKYKESSPENFWKIRCLDKYMALHNGFIAGGCFKNILSDEKVKDIDIFFESRSDFDDAVALFESNAFKKNGWKFKYENDKVKSFQKEGDNVYIELIRSVFGTPEQILRQFDFTVAKFAYYKKVVQNEPTDEIDKLLNGDLGDSVEYRILYHEDYFEHLHTKRLVLDDNIPFPISTWERSYRYKGYGFNMCRESKIKLLDALRKSNDNIDVSFYNLGGWD